MRAVLQTSSTACGSQALLTRCSGAAARRLLSLLSWGRNEAYQCGIEGQEPLITQPTVVLDLLQQPISSIAAGRNNSAAVVQGHDVYVWGDGACGKLGLGSGGTAGSPTRVEAFVGRTSIQGVSLGHQHSLFLDAGGCLWAAGENKEGQCGLGTPLAELARMHRQAFENTFRRIGTYLQQLEPMDRYELHLQAASAAQAAGAQHYAQGWGTLQDSSWQRQDWTGAASSGAGHGRRRGSWLSSSGGQHSSGVRVSPGRSMRPDASSGLGMLGGPDMHAQMRALQMQPGQAHMPVRVGCDDAHSLLLQSQFAEQQQQASGDSGDNSVAGSGNDGSLANEQVVSMAAGKYFSAVVTARGEVWTFGACYNGALGSEDGTSWQTSATRVSRPIADAIAARGGAVGVAAGSTFVAVLTASGRVVLWGKLVTSSNGSRRILSHAAVQPIDAAAGEDGSSAGSSVGWCEAALPDSVHITHIAAGQQHLLLSDGERVWAVGRWMDSAGVEVGCAPAQHPAVLLELPGEGVSKLAAGMHSSAIVDGTGQLWMCGRLMDPSQAHSLLHAGWTAPGAGSEAAAAMRRAGGAAYKRVDWDWAGFGGGQPRLVAGLHGVKDVALGGWHALVLAG